MDKQNVIVGSGPSVARVDEVDRVRIWRLVWGFGVLFVLAGAVDLGAAIGPLDFSNRALRFTTAAGLMAGWPILALGSVGALLGAAGLGNRRLVTLASVLHAVLAVTLVVAFLVLALDRGAAMTVAGPATATVTIGFFRALLSGVCFLIVHVLAVRAGVRHG